MHGVTRKVTATALAVVLLFCTVAPVPTGAAMFDRARANQAYANPIAGTAAEMALLAFQTACVAGGIYIAGTTLSELNINSQEIYEAFSDYYTAQNNISQSELEAILAGSYTNGNIDLSALTAAGITGAIPGFAATLLNGGNAVSGVDSASGNSKTVAIGSLVFDTQRMNDYVQLAEIPSGYTVVYQYYSAPGNNGWGSYEFYAVVPSEISLSVQSGMLKIGAVSGSYHYYKRKVDFNRRTLETSVANATVGTSAGVSINALTVPSNYSSNVLNIDFPFDTTAGVIGTNAAATAAAVVADGVTAGTFQATQGVVQAFDPTAEQLQTGYDASILQGVEQAVADLGTISTGIAALDATMNGLLGVCQGIASTLSNTVVGQYCAAVTQWLGATPFGTVMGTVIDGLDAIPDSVADGAAVVAGGVAALPGALEGVIEGVLEGVFGQPLAIPGAIQQLIDLVNAGFADLTGAIEGIQFPDLPPKFDWPSGEPGSIAVPVDLDVGGELEMKLRDKVPFCYVIRSYQAIGQMFGNFSNARSFYLDIEVPNAGTVHFDGEQVLTQRLGGNDIATTIRILATSLLCLGLLYRAYKVVERTANAL